MSAEPEIITNGPLRPLSEIRSESGFAWSCRRALFTNGELTEIHEIFSGDRAEYGRHMRAHGYKPLKTSEQPKPWKPPRTTAAYAPKQMDPGQPIKWTQVIEGYWQHGYNPDEPESNVRVSEQRVARTGVIWSVATHANEFWVQPDDDPAHPVLVKRAGKRDHSQNEGDLFEVPGHAEAATAQVHRAEIIRRRGIFPVIDSQSVYDDGYQRGRTNHIYLRWHSDPHCSQAAGKDRYDPGHRPQGIVYGYRPEGRGIRTLGQPRWSVLDVADALVSGQQAPAVLCPDCIINLGISPPGVPAGTGGAEAIGDPAAPDEPEHDSDHPPVPPRPGGARFTVILARPRTDAEFLESCVQLGDVLSSLAGQVHGWAGELSALNLPAPVLDRLHQAADGITEAAGGAARAATAFEDEFAGARDVASCGLHFTGPDTA
jgi:hypothetical protein